MYSYEKTNTDPRYPFETSDGHVFEAEIAAKNFCKMWNDHFAALKTIADVPYELSRQAYEEACQNVSVSILPDQRCGSYGVARGEFTPWLEGGEIAGSSSEDAVKMALAAKRGRGIKQEREVKPQPKQVAPELIKCNCGHAVSSVLVMSASRGSSCPDCYDKMSD